MPSNYYELYFPVLLQVILAIAVACGLVGGGLLLGKRVRTTAKDTPYESGMQPVGSARERFSVKFYLVAMVFILFDIEAIFLYPWAVVFRELRIFAFLEMLLFIVLVLAGFFYIWKRGVLDWSQEAMREFAQEGATGKRKPELGPGAYTLTAHDRPEYLAGAGQREKA
jgi:NADH-quinone oxidoreductase subunit A